MTNISPLWLTILTSFFAFLITTLGGAVIFCFKNINKVFMQLILSFSAGIMIASSIFSLILESVEQCLIYNQNKGLIVTFGVLAGIMFIIFIEILVEKFIFNKKSNKAFNKNKKQSLMSTFAISFHNIPEGLCIGVAFAGASIINSQEAVLSAILLSVGIALQNFPEGASVSMPLFNSGFSKRYSFSVALISGIVEPIFAIIGYFCTSFITQILPFSLNFAAGTMIAVSCTELLPESLGENKNIATLGLGLGFCFMTFMDLMF